MRTENVSNTAGWGSLQCVSLVAKIVAPYAEIVNRATSTLGYMGSGHVPLGNGALSRASGCNDPSTPVELCIVRRGGNAVYRAVSSLNSWGQVVRTRVFPRKRVGREPTGYPAWVKLQGKE